MKKFTFMLIAAFVAVASWAGVPVKKATALQLQNVVQLDAQKKAPKLVKAAAPFKVTAPVTNRLAAKVKANVRRAPKKAGIADLLKGGQSRHFTCSGKAQIYQKCCGECQNDKNCPKKKSLYFLNKGFLLEYRNAAIV